MKLLFNFLILSNYLLLAQVPQGFTYQAVATDNNGLELVEQNVSVRVSILSEFSSGTEQWIETHSTTTDGFGLFTIAIGEGSPDGGIQSSFSDIDWGGSEHHLKIEMDVNGGSEYQLLGTSQLMSVPYALHAGSSDQGDSQSEQIDSLETVIQDLTSSVNSMNNTISSGSTANGNSSFYSICDFGFTSDTILELGSGIGGVYANEMYVRDDGVYIIYYIMTSSLDANMYGVDIPSQYSDSFLLVKYDLNGNVLWQRSTETFTVYNKVELVIDDEYCFILFSSELNTATTMSFSNYNSIISSNSGSHIFKISTSDGVVISALPGSNDVSDIDIYNEELYLMNGGTLQTTDFDFNLTNNIITLQQPTANDNYEFKINSYNGDIGLGFNYAANLSKFYFLNLNTTYSLIWQHEFHTNTGIKFVFQLSDVLIFNEDSQPYNGSSYSYTSVAHTIEKYTSSGIKIWEYNIDLYEYAGNPKIDIKALNDSSYLIKYNCFPWSVKEEVFVGDYGYYGRNDCEFIFQDEISIQQKEHQEVYFDLLSVENSKTHRLIYDDRDICINNEIFPSNKLYLLINTD